MNAWDENIEMLCAKITLVSLHRLVELERGEADDAAQLHHLLLPLDLLGNHNGLFTNKTRQDLIFCFLPCN